MSPEQQADDLILRDGEIPADGIDVFVVTTDDLSPDANNEVVVASLDGVPITILATEDIADSGIAGVHVTATGIDVDGLEYVSFSSGLKVFYEPDAVRVRR
jgi:hypothetical protein